jgi:hypothetical protein
MLKVLKLNYVTELSKRFRELLQDSSFLEAVSGHMPADSISQQRVSAILDAMELIADL